MAATHAVMECTALPGGIVIHWTPQMSQAPLHLLDPLLTLHVTRLHLVAPGWAAPATSPRDKQIGSTAAERAEMTHAAPSRGTERCSLGSPNVAGTTAPHLCVRHGCPCDAHLGQEGEYCGITCRRGIRRIGRYYRFTSGSPVDFANGPPPGPLPRSPRHQTGAIESG